MAVHAGDAASVVSIGKSVEGREMKVLSLTKAGPGAPNVWIEAGKQWPNRLVDAVESLHLYGPTGKFSPDNSPTGN